MCNDICFAMLSDSYKNLYCPPLLQQTKTYFFFKPNFNALQPCTKGKVFCCCCCMANIFHLPPWKAMSHIWGIKFQWTVIFGRFSAEDEQRPKLSLLKLLFTCDMTNVTRYDIALFEKNYFSLCYSDIPNRVIGTFWNITLLRGKLFYKKCYSTSLHISFFHK